MHLTQFSQNLSQQGFAAHGVGGRIHIEAVMMAEQDDSLVRILPEYFPEPLELNQPIGLLIGISFDK